MSSDFFVTYVPDRSESAELPPVSPPLNTGVLDREVIAEPRLLRIAR